MTLIPRVRRTQKTVGKQTRTLFSARMTRFVEDLCIIDLTESMQVGRVKNKWKCILKDGMIHINGKDYLFAKCTG